MNYLPIETHTFNTQRYVHPEYQMTMEQLKIVNDLYKGIDFSRQYILPRPLENPKDFLQRRKVAILDNYIERLVTIQAGMITRKELVYDVPKSVMTDLQNLDIETFVKQVTTKLIRDGKTFVMIDIPENGGEPYFLSIDRANVVNWEYTDLEKKHLKWVLIKESIATRPDKTEPFHVEYKEQYRHIEEGKVTIYNDVEGVLVPVKEIKTTKGPYVYEVKLQDVPPLYDIANINIAHMNIYSVLDESTMTAMIPSLFTKGLGLDDNKELKFSTNATINTDNTDADIKWLELSGQSIPYGVENLKRKEDLMKERGSKFVSGAIKTATQVESENIEGNSRNKTIASEMNKLLKNLIDDYCSIKYLRPMGTVQIHSDFKIGLDQGLIAPLSQAVVAGNLSLETFLAAIEDAEVIRLDSVQNEIQRIKKENSEAIFGSSVG